MGDKSNGAPDAVRTLLRRFQEGYARRDLQRLDAFMELFSSRDDLEVIGTNAVTPGQDEWCLGQQATRQLVAGDWEHWGDVVLDVDGARIAVEGGVAWLATTGTVTDTITTAQRYDGYVQYAQSVLQDAHKSAQSKTLDIVGLGNDIVLGLPLSETFVWPFRFAAVAVLEGSRWRFRQMQFSFATTRAPDVRSA